MSLAGVARHAESGPTDAALVTASRAGEVWAKEALFRRYVDQVNAFAYRLLGRDHEVDDVVQDSLAQALTCLHKLQDPQAFASWLCGIVVRTVSRRLRHRRMLERLGLRRTVDADSTVLISPAAPAEVVLELRAIYRLVEMMPAQMRVIFMLRRVEGMALPEIAELVGVSLATVKRRLAEAGRRFEDAFGVREADA